MQLSLINQILVENDYIQTLHVGQEPASFISSYKRLKRLVQQLKRFKPTEKGYCLAFTILSDYVTMDLQKMQQNYYRAQVDRLSKTTYALFFERLQYQTNLAVSMLS